MKLKTLIWDLVFVLISAALALWASIPSKESSDQRVEVISIDAKSIGSFVYEQPGTLAKATYSDDSKKWHGDVSRKEEGKPDVKEEFVVSDRFDEALSRLKPLEAIRVIKNPKGDELKDFGLDQPSKTLKVISRKGEPVLELQVGKQSYGTTNIYVRNVKAQNVWLVSGDLVGDIEKLDNRYYERNLTKTAFDDFKSAIIRRNGQEKNLIHTLRDAQGNLAWAAEGGDKPVETYRTWFDKFERLKVVRFARSDEHGKLESTPAAFGVEMSSDGKNSEKFTVKKIMNSGSDPEYWIHSGFLSTYALLPASRVQPLETDLKSTFGI